MMIVKLLALGRCRQLHTIISRQTIKPSSPTPSHLNTYNLSSIDNLNDHKFVPLILLYPNNSNCSISAHHKTQEMKKSLSQSLTQYYPMAGRLHTPITPYIDCNDEGVVFVEAKSDRQLRTFQHNSEVDASLDQLFADDLVWNNYPGSKNIVGVQVNHFACGGMAVAVSMSHKIGDACTLGTFCNYWASVTRFKSTDNEEVVPLNPHIILSQRTNSIQTGAQDISQGKANNVMRKFVFPNTKLNDLKSMLSSGSSSLNNPTRVEVLTSLLYKTAVEAATKKSGCFKPSYLIMPVNLRNKFIPKLPQTAVGNMLSVMMTRTTHSTETSLDVIVAEIKKQKTQLEWVQSVQDAVETQKMFEQKMGNEDIDDVTHRQYWCSSLCGFPYYKVDFGWGKPMDAIMPPGDRTGFVLKDTPDEDGIEALVMLEKEDMEIFQNDKEMLSFC